MNIDLNWLTSHEWKTRNGYPARIICSDKLFRGGLQIVALIKTDDEVEVLRTYTDIDKANVVIKSIASRMDDLVVGSQFDNWSIDALVKCFDKDWNDSEAVLRYFADVIDGVPYVWANGATSITANGEMETFGVMIPVDG